MIGADGITLTLRTKVIVLPILVLDFTQNFGKNNCLKLLLGNNITFMVGYFEFELILLVSTFNEIFTTTKTHTCPQDSGLNR